MKKISGLIFVLAISVFLVGSGPIGCSKTTLAPQGIYHSDTFLYQTEKTIVTAYKSFDSFLVWEKQYRDILPVEVSRAADVIRLNAKKWIDSASELRDAYVKTPTAENKDKLALSVNLIDTALSEATKYMAQHKSKAPNTGISK